MIRLGSDKRETKAKNKKATHEERQHQHLDSKKDGTMLALAATSIDFLPIRGVSSFRKTKSWLHGSLTDWGDGGVRRKKHTWHI